MTTLAHWPRRGAAALIRGYQITIPRDAVCAFEGVEEDDALDYLHSIYGATITTVDDLVTDPVLASN